MTRRRSVIEMAEKESFWKNFIVFQLLRFIILNIKILKGVDHSKRLPAFVIKYKVSYLVKDSGFPPTMVNTRKPPQAGDKIQFGGDQFEVVEVHQLMRPRGEFCYLQATCRFTGNSGGK